MNEEEKKTEEHMLKMDFLNMACNFGTNKKSTLELIELCIEILPKLKELIEKANEDKDGFGFLDNDLNEYFGSISIEEINFLNEGFSANNMTKN